MNWVPSKALEEPRELGLGAAVHSTAAGPAPTHTAKQTNSPAGAPAPARSPSRAAPANAGLKAPGIFPTTLLMFAVSQVYVATQ